MPTEKQSWLKKYDSYYAATEYNRKHYGKRIRQLKRMLKDEKFLEFLSHPEHKEIYKYNTPPKKKQKQKR